MGILQIIKKKEKPSVIRYTRSDGSVTWRKLHRGTEDHDLAHYAVESVLGLKRAFLGLLENGIDIGDYELPQSDKPGILSSRNLPYEAQVTEYIVNLLQTDRWNSHVGQDFLRVLARTLEDRGIEFPDFLNEVNLEKIRELHTELSARWLQLPYEGTLHLEVDWT